MVGKHNNSDEHHISKISPKVGAVSAKSASSETSIRQKLAAAVRRASFGWLGTLTDVSLVSLYLLVAGGSAHPGNINRIYATAGKLFSSLQTKRWQKSLQRSLYNLAESGLIENRQITNKGFARLKQLIPTYIEDRPWNGWLYLTVYDIPENLCRSRKKLSNLMKQLSFGCLQKSVWVSFEDPEPFLADLIEWDELEDFVVTVKSRVSPRIRKGLIPLLAKAFKLDNLNLHYRAFINLVKDGKTAPEDLAVRYLAVLKDDPQLPFRLLPKDWLGDKAYNVYLKQVIPRMPHEYGQFISKLDRLA